STPPPPAQDPFATQVGTKVDAAALAKEISKAKAAKQSPPPPDMDSMQTVLGMPAMGIPPKNPPPQNQADDMMKTVVSMPTMAPPTPSSSDPMATVVGMQAMMPPMPPPPSKVEPAPKEKPPAAPPHATSAPFAQ